MSTPRPSRDEHERFVLVLEPLKGWGWTLSATQRLRLALKTLLRRFGLRAVECRPDNPSEPDHCTAQLGTSNTLANGGSPAPR
jgi:hypothetical protein